MFKVGVSEDTIQNGADEEMGLNGLYGLFRQQECVVKNVSSLFIYFYKR